MPLVRNALRIAAVLCLAACASTAGERNSATSNRMVLTTEELQAEVGRNLEDVIRQRRPQWLTRRGSTTLQEEGEILVYQDGTRMGGPAFLRTIQAESVESVQFLTAGEATTRFGTGHVHGAIVVTTRRR